MDASEIAALRGVQAQGAAGDSQGAPGDEEAQQQAAARRQAEQDMKREMLATVLDHGARERLARISLVRPALSTKVEAMVARMAQSGQLRSQITEQQLISLLESADQAEAAAAPKKTTIVYSRRKFDEDDDLDFDI